MPGKARWIIVVAILVLALAGAAVLMIAAMNQGSREEPKTPPAVVTSTADVPCPTATDAAPITTASAGEAATPSAPAKPRAQFPT
jgi:hypothetical protein